MNGLRKASCKSERAGCGGGPPDALCAQEVDQAGDARGVHAGGARRVRRALQEPGGARNSLYKHSPTLLTKVTGERAAVPVDA